MKALLIGMAAALAAVFSSGCGTTDGSVSSAAERSWELGSRVGEAPGKFVVCRGTSQDVIRNLLGEPTKKKPGTKDPKVEEWIYERRVEFGYSQKGMNVGAGRVNSYQRQRYSETARILFKEGQVDDVRVLRYPEDIEGDPTRGVGR